MVVIGLVGSPRKNMRTNSLVDAALEGSKSRGVEIEKIYLVDYKIRPFTGQGGSDEAFQYCPEDLSKLCEEADAIILGAPVYWGDINGLTKNFMDTVRLRLPNINGKPALGIAIAGGSGKGLFSGIQSIYHFFFHKQMRGIEPTPVSRFNLDSSFKDLRMSGAKLADLSKEKSPFSGETVDERWPEVLAYYAALKYLNCDPVDEFMTLAGDLIKISKGDKVEKAKTELETATSLIAKGQRAEASKHAVRSYQILYFAG
ncbi:MAG: red protein [Thermoproteota archaeon]|nr:red protein [Thermoproteota archaeon]